MGTYKIIIEVVKGNGRIINTYEIANSYIFEALEKARFLASMQLDEEHADYVKRVSVVKLEEKI